MFFEIINRIARLNYVRNIFKKVHYAVHNLKFDFQQIIKFLFSAVSFTHKIPQAKD